MNTTGYVNLGVIASKRENRDELFRLMREIVSKNRRAAASQAVAIGLCQDAIEKHFDCGSLKEEAIRYCLANLWRRCIEPSTTRERDDRRPEREKRAKEIIIAHVVLWDLMLPTVGKRLCDCTFAEVAAAAPVVGKFLSKLATQGAPGSLVREVFPTKKALQDFWAEAQHKG